MWTLLDYFLVITNDKYCTKNVDVILKGCRTQC